MKSSELSLIQHTFPGSIGVQVHICGWLIVLFPLKNALEGCWKGGIVDGVGALPVGYNVATNRYTTGIIEAGQSITDRLSNYSQAASGVNRLQLTNPPNTPRITEWRPYEEFLQGSPMPVFINRHNVITGTPSTREGYGIRRVSQEAIAHGVQYTWDTKSRAPSTALLWRTLLDSDTVQGTFGNVLCLKRPSDS